MKIIGVLDGHGVHGDKVSSFAASMLLNYIRNVKGSFFNSNTLVSSTHLEIETELKRCFKYVQKRIKQQHYKFKKMQAKLAKLNDDEDDPQKQQNFKHCLDSSESEQDASKVDTFLEDSSWDSGEKETF